MRIFKKNLTKQRISFETTDQISTSNVLVIDEGVPLRLAKISSPGKFISPRLTPDKVLKKCSILGNRSLSLCFTCFLNFECAYSPMVNCTRFSQRLFDAYYLACRDRDFSFCKAILYKTTARQIVAKRVCGYVNKIRQNDEYLSKPPIRSRRAPYSL